MIVYAIKHTPTGRFMPARMFKQSGAGWSWWEPTETRSGYLPHDDNPRIFYTKQAAVNALGQWLRGPLRKYRESSGHDFLGHDDEVFVGVDEAAKSPTRIRSHMAIIELKIAGL